MSNNAGQSKTKEFLSSHNYVVKIEKILGGCAAMFPCANLMRPTVKQTQSEKVTYKIKKGKNSGVKINKEFFSVPEYAVRMVVAADIIKRMNDIKIDQSLIAYEDYENDNEVCLMSVLDPPTDPEAFEKECNLVQLSLEATRNNFDRRYEELAKIGNIEEGYRLIQERLFRAKP
jgi:hypothetical protein